MLCWPWGCREEGQQSAEIQTGFCRVKGRPLKDLQFIYNDILCIYIYISSYIQSILEPSRIPIRFVESALKDSQIGCPYVFQSLYVLVVLSF